MKRIFVLSSRYLALGVVASGLVAVMASAAPKTPKRHVTPSKPMKKPIAKPASVKASMHTKAISGGRQEAEVPYVASRYPGVFVRSIPSADGSVDVHQVPAERDPRDGVMVDNDPSTFPSQTAKVAPRKAVAKAAPAKAKTGKTAPAKTARHPAK